MLRVTKLTDYATLLMTVLAERTDGVYSTTGLAERAGLELPTVAKILKQLGQAGLVNSTRGASGAARAARVAAIDWHARPYRSACWTSSKPWKVGWR